jgi:hypothetical protein
MLISFDFDNFTISYCCSFVFIPAEATIRRRINVKARAAEKYYRRPLDILPQTGKDAVASALGSREHFPTDLWE